MEKIKREKYRISSVVALLLGLSILMPAPASKPCLLGYYAHCTFTPISTIICWVVAGVCYWLGQKRALKKAL